MYNYSTLCIIYSMVKPTISNSVGEGQNLEVGLIGYSAKHLNVWEWSKNIKSESYHYKNFRRFHSIPDIKMHFG